MTEPSEGQRTGAEHAAGRAGSEVAGGSPLATAPGPGSSSAVDASPAAASGAPVGRSKALLGPFTLRELVFGGGVLLVFIGTLLPFIDGIVRYANFWNSVPLFFVGIGILLPVIALALLAGRRLGSSGLRVGSLSVDQFASVAAVLAATFFFLQTVTAFHAGPLLALIGSLGMLAATVAGPFLPVIKDDFADRPEVPAHTAARPITAARPRPPKPVKPAEATADSSDAPSRAGSGMSFGAGSRTGEPDRPGVNPAAAAVRQNGAGLYGAGGAGAVGAGAAASGQSGLERGAYPRTAGHESEPAEVAASPSPGADATARGRDDIEADRSSVRPTDAGAPDTTSSRAEPVPVDETRVHGVVRDEATRTYAVGGSSEERSRQEPITATRSAEEEAVVEAFWFAVGSPRPVFDEQTGREVFTLQPGDWEVGIEDRGSEFLVQDKRTGAVGVLRDLRNIERAPRD